MAEKKGQHADRSSSDRAFVGGAGAATSEINTTQPEENAQVKHAIAVVSPALAAPAYGPQVHEQALRRLRELSGMDVVEYPTTRDMTASPQARARDLSAAFADPRVVAIMATNGGNDEITILRHLDEQAIVGNPKPFFGYSDNTHFLNWLYQRGVMGFYGGATQVHLGAGPRVDAEHEIALRAALAGAVDVGAVGAVGAGAVGAGAVDDRDAAGLIEITRPVESEDYGFDWQDPRALSEFGQRTQTEPWCWSGPQRRVRGRTWGGCVQSVRELLVAGALRDDALVDDGILLLELAEAVMDPIEYGEFLRALGERGILGRVAGALFALPPASSFSFNPPVAAQRAYRNDIRDLSLAVMEEYNPAAVAVFGVPFGHTRPQWILPYGGFLEVDGRSQRIFADYRFAR